MDWRIRKKEAKKFDVIGLGHERALVVQGGYASGRGQQLTVTRKTNALAAGKDKDKDRSPTPAGKDTPRDTPPPVAPHVEKLLSDLADEIRKLKSVIVKQENRIRALEANAKAAEAPAPAPAPTPSPQPETNHGEADGMAPDEV
ncbi:unnamed protein product [Plutella xylostella]|uniref:(diamondback moth) hypothetical protein n=1 Tax=Plutella xylostella TaxID=51655 RepID=A0A8S4FGE1_PLUXY|nr:unnamed protein product [Plutella xylostella]